MAATDPSKVFLVTRVPPGLGIPDLGKKSRYQFVDATEDKPVELLPEIAIPAVKRYAQTVLPADAANNPANATGPIDAVLYGPTCLICYMPDTSEEFRAAMKMRGFAARFQGGPIICIKQTGVDIPGYDSMDPGTICSDQVTVYTFKHPVGMLPGFLTMLVSQRSWIRNYIIVAANKKIPEYMEMVKEMDPDKRIHVIRGDLIAALLRIYIR